MVAVKRQLSITTEQHQFFVAPAAYSSSLGVTGLALAMDIEHRPVYGPRAARRLRVGRMAGRALSAAAAICSLQLCSCQPLYSRLSISNQRHSKRTSGPCDQAKLQRQPDHLCRKWTRSLVPLPANPL
jgi:hypothetical protein